MRWSLAGFLTLLEATIIVLMWKGAKGGSTRRGINLEKLISEHDGSASFSRFQFLIFTFVVASAYVIYAFESVATSHGLPGIDTSVLGLIGISGGSYIVSKGIEHGTNGAHSGKTPPGATEEPKPQTWPNLLTK
jgi:hypothetical protein